MTPPQNAEPPPPKSRRSWITWLVLAGLLALFWWWQSAAGEAMQPDVDYTQAVEWIKADKVKSVLMRGDSLTGELTAPNDVWI